MLKLSNCVSSLWSRGHVLHRRLWYRRIPSSPSPSVLSSKLSSDQFHFPQERRSHLQRVSFRGRSDESGDALCLFLRSSPQLTPLPMEAKKETDGIGKICTFSLPMVPYNLSFFFFLIIFFSSHTDVSTSCRLSISKAARQNMQTENCVIKR